MTTEETKVTITPQRRRVGAVPRFAGTFNVVMALTVVLSLVVTELTWDACAAGLDVGRVSLESCQQQMADGHARSFLLAIGWLAGDAWIAAVWQRRRRIAGVRSSAVAWSALGLTVAGILAMLKVGNLIAWPPVLVTPGLAVGLVALRRFDAGGRRDEVARASVAIGCVGVAIGVAMLVVA